MITIPVEDEKPTESVAPSRKTSAMSLSSSVARSSVSTGNRFFRMAQSAVFEFNKARICLKENLQKHTPGLRPHHGWDVPGKKFDNAFLHHELSRDLSSIPMSSPLSPSHRSAPDLLFGDSFYRTTSVADLGESTLLRVARLLDGKSVHHLSQTCHGIRTTLLENSDQLSKRTATNYELIIAFNNEKQKVDVRAARRTRSLTDEVYTASHIDDVIPKLVCLFGKITFGAGVNVRHFARSLLMLYSSGRLIPLALIFGGGENCKGCQLSGADLRGFSESEFLHLIARFYPHLQEIQLRTARLFKASSTSARLLSLISVVSCFGIIYERPALRYDFHDVQRIASYWRHDPMSRACVAYIRRPTSANTKGWNDIGGMVEERDDKLVVTIPHFFIDNTKLVFHFH